MAKAKVEVAGVSHEFYDSNRQSAIKALSNINITINEQEFACILGPSGCGKSTLLNIIAGFMKPTQGHVALDGKEVTRPGPDRAMVFQEQALFPWLTVEGNVEFGLEMQGLQKKERKPIAKKYIELVDLRGFEDRYPFELSGGMKQRLGLARSLAIDPHVLLLDEPFAALDAQARRIMQEELLMILSKTKKTSILVTHSIDEAVFLADRLVVLSARPGTILLNEVIQLPRPRSRADQGFVRMAGKIDDMIRVEVNKAAGKEVPIGEARAGSIE
ncbi:MAG: ABC transporter ATP-binding protein [Nitrososphaerota archaeon]|nr:ABC transporter ATP-binding protein [Nitrososphaerota archaeon]